MSAANDQAKQSGRAAGETAGEGERLMDDARAELAALRAQVEKLMAERVKPALADAAGKVEAYAEQAKEKVEAYAGQARDKVAENADALAERVKERPLTALAIAAVGGWLLGRLMAGNTYVYPTRH